MLVLDRLRYAHPGQRTPYDFSMEALRGEICAISGPSGSGKSTLLDLIAGFLVPESGTLTLDGKPLAGLPPERRPVSLLLQSESLFEHLSAERNVLLGLRPGAADARARAARALADVGLEGLGPQLSATLSGGQKQRVALARTLLRDSAILLLDEPFSALDDATRRTSRELVRKLTDDQGWITILVSHHEDDVEALADRRYRIVEGLLRRG